MSSIKPRDLKAQQPPVILVLCSSKKNVIISEKLRFENVLRSHVNVTESAFSNFFVLKSSFEKLRFSGGLVWTVGLAGESIKLLFCGGLVWTVGLTVEIKFCFRGG